MELCDKKTLRDKIEILNTDCVLAQYRHEMLGWFIDICAGVEVIHNANMIHRDLSPANILFSKDNKIRIGDFGSATNSPYETHSSRVGNRYYASPEQLKSKKYNKTSDLYSLVIRLYNS